MSLPLFLTDTVPAAGQTFRLDGPEGRHAADVQRLKVNERLLLGDGVGITAVCLVTAAPKGAVDLLVEEHAFEPALTPRLIVVQGLPKGDRAELAVQAMTEVGVDEIVPWQAARAITHWRGDRGRKALDKWRVVAREAGKQSRRAWLPKITDLQSTTELDPTFVLHEEAELPLSSVDLPPGDLTLVVGPEGGIDPSELAVFLTRGARPVRLGSTVLRTSTAGAAALAVLSARLGRW